MKVRVLALVIVLFTLSPTLGQQNMTWTASYYDNPYANGVPVLTQQESDIDHNWDDNSPAPGIPPDYFSAFWTTELYLASGEYRVIVQADDAVRLRVNGYSVFDTFLQPLPGQSLSTDLSLTEGVYRIEVEYREDTGNAYIFFDWLTLPRPSVDPVVIPSTPSSSGDSSIWTAEYFTNTNLEGIPTVVRGETDPTHYWGTGAPAPGIPADNFSARWSSTLTLTPGRYQIVADADDGIRVRVDGLTLIDEWHLANSQIYDATINLTGTTHTFVIEYFEQGILAYLNFTLKYLGPVDEPNIPTGAFLTTGSFTVNVRTQPTTDSPVITRINPGEAYMIVGRNLDKSWWQIRVEDREGWVFGRFVIPRDAANVPVTNLSSPTTVIGTGYTLIAQDNISIRAETRTGAAFLGTLREGQRAEIIATTSDHLWWKIRYDGAVGWVRNGAVVVDPGIPLTFIPIEE